MTKENRLKIAKELKKRGVKNHPYFSELDKKAQKEERFEELKENIENKIENAIDKMEEEKENGK